MILILLLLDVNLVFHEWLVMVSEISDFLLEKDALNSILSYDDWWLTILDQDSL